MVKLNHKMENEVRKWQIRKRTSQDQVLGIMMN